MRNERLVLISSNDVAADFLKRTLSGEHRVIARIASLADFNKRLKSGSLAEATVAIIDNKMPTEGMGKGIAKLLTDKYPGIKIVSFSKDVQNWADASIVNSPQTSTHDIRQTILGL